MITREISTHTLKFHADFFKGINFFNNLTSGRAIDSYLIYGGAQNFESEKGNICSWNSLPIF